MLKAAVALPFAIRVVVGLLAVPLSNTIFSVDAFVPPARTNVFEASSLIRVPRRTSLANLRSENNERRLTRLWWSNNAGGNGDNNNNNNSESTVSWLRKRLEKADERIILRDVAAATCFVYLRYFAYEATRSFVTGHEGADFFSTSSSSLGGLASLMVDLTGSLSSATVLVSYWTVAGLLTRSFEKRPYYDSFRPYVQTLVNVALICPAWLFTEHVLGLGPNDVAGSCFSTALTPGFVELSAAMLLGRRLIPVSNNGKPE